jgi:uncharacterized protein YigA (DUF484 family)
MPPSAPEVERLLEEIRSRVRHVEERRRSGATEWELERHRNEIGRLKSRLADLVSAGTPD